MTQQDGRRTETPAGLFTTQIERATVVRFAIALALLIGYSLWAFTGDGPWTRSLETAGGVLPEMRPGIPAVEPQRTIDLLRTASGSAVQDYVAWQLVDVVYAALNVAVVSFGISLGLKGAGLQRTAFRYALFVPVLYGVCEIMENALLAAFATGSASPFGGVALAQQTATTAKFGFALTGYAFALLGVGVFVVRGLMSKTRDARP